MTVFEIKGWCPGALRPMMSGDGLVVRVRPHGGCLSAAQARGIALAAREHGSGLIDLSSRANLQLRGVSRHSHAPLLAALDALGLVDADPQAEARRNVVVTPFANESGEDFISVAALAASLESALASSGLALSGKFGFAIDCGRTRVLSAVSADIRLERGLGDRLIVRPDGAEMGVPVEPAEVAGVALAIARWFVETGGASDGRGRMAAHIREGAVLPTARTELVSPVAATRRPEPGLTMGGALVGIAFGAMHADTLDSLAQQASELRITPWRMIFLPGVDGIPSVPELISQGDDPLLRIEACPGAPWCPQARAETRALARSLAAHVPAGSTLHVSGCAKGCACPRSATSTLVATATGYDLVRNGTASDPPEKMGLSASELAAHPARYLGVA